MCKWKTLHLVLACCSAACVAQGRLDARFNFVSLPNSFSDPASDGAQTSDPAGHRMVLTVAVTDASGNPVANLKQSDFTVTDNQQARAIEGFREVAGGSLGATAHAVLVIDAVNDTSSSALERQAKGIEEFLSSAKEPLPYPVSIALVSGAELTESPASRDRETLAGEVRDLTRSVRVVDCANQDAMSSDEAGSQAMDSGVMGATLNRVDNNSPVDTGGCFARHLERSLSALEKIAREQSGSSGRALIVWIGPGWPLLFGRKARETAQGKPSWFDRAVSLTNLLREAQATVDVVSPTDFEHGKEFRHVDWNGLYTGAAGQASASEANVALPVIARQSGGTVFGKSTDMAANIGACLTNADHYYAMTYDAARGGASNELRSIDVKVDRPGATVHSATLYYAQP